MTPTPLVSFCRAWKVYTAIEAALGLCLFYVYPFEHSARTLPIIGHKRGGSSQRLGGLELLSYAEYPFWDTLPFRGSFLGTS